jgi:hypothetical protein
LIDWLWVKRRFDALIDAALFLVALKWIGPAVLQGFELGLILGPALACFLALAFASTLVFDQEKKAWLNEKGLVMHSTGFEPTTSRPRGHRPNPGLLPDARLARLRQ